MFNKSKTSKDLEHLAPSIPCWCNVAPTRKKILQPHDQSHELQRSSKSCNKGTAHLNTPKMPGDTFSLFLVVMIRHGHDHNCTWGAGRLGQACFGGEFRLVLAAPRSQPILQQWDMFCGKHVHDGPWTLQGPFPRKIIQCVVPDTDALFALPVSSLFHSPKESAPVSRCGARCAQTLAVVDVAVKCYEFTFSWLDYSKWWPTSNFSRSWVNTVSSANKHCFNGRCI